MLKKILLLALLYILPQCNYSQASKANRYFERGDFLRAAVLYEEALTDQRSKEYLEKLADCFYNTYQYEKGIITLEALVKGDFEEEYKYISERYHFIYYQLLSATGDYEKALIQLQQYREKINAPVPDFEESKENVERFRLKRSDFTINKVAFNSSASDYGAIQKNDSIYFSSDRESKSTTKSYNWTHRPFLDLYAVLLDTVSDMTQEPKPLPAIINSKLHEGSLTFTAKGDTMYFSRSNQKKGKNVFNKLGENQVQLYRSHKSNGIWTKPTKLPFCQDQFNYQHPALSPDGKKLYFATDASGGYGSYDIVWVPINNDASYGAPINMGDVINTPNREQFPYVSEEGHLFFASNGHLGLGLLDLFVSEFKEDTFEIPSNLGTPINSRYDDFSLTYSEDNHGYFSSNRDAINDDIFTFEQVSNLFEKEYINLIKIVDSTNQKSVPSTQVILKNVLGETVYENSLDKESAFNINLVSGVYSVEIAAPGFGITLKELTITEENNDEHVLPITKLFDVDLTKLPGSLNGASKDVITKLLKDKTPPKILRINDTFYLDVPHIYFDFNKWDIREDSKILLNNLILKLTEYPTLKIRINSHTDSRGSAIFNQVLSEKRGQSTREYIVSVGGIDGSRISFKGFGKSKLLFECNESCTEKEHQKNRRSQFELVGY